ncbi:hypothetical protein [Streptomyces monomycini]|uniref:hypothetical protein n=1 Tax=Streptomyces monomycini TaxID=371720 RepID=UPI0004AA3C1B|nr:hypothetical protein [Streptomyces monomycini]
MITETAFCDSLVGEQRSSEEQTSRPRTPPGPPRPGRDVPRIQGIGDALAAARTQLDLRVDEAREAINAVLPTAPGSPAALPPVPVEPRLVLEHAHFLLSTYLDSFLAAVFNGDQSVRLPVSGKRLKKVSRRLRDAIEEFVARREPVATLAEVLADGHPGLCPATYERTAAAMLVLAAWDASHMSPTAERTESLLRSVDREGRVRLALFVCPPVDFTQINGERPELYLLDHMHGSVLSRLAGRLRELFRGLECAGVEVELLALIGDTDEDDYLWSGIPVPARLDRLALDARREALIDAVADYLTEEIPGPRGSTHPRVFSGKSLTVQRLSAMAPSTGCQEVYACVLEAPFAYFDQRDLDAEAAIMRGLWGPGSYYDGLPEPDAEALAGIIVRKFATYAMQGRLLREIDPDLVLIQTERPPLLRARMLNVGWDKSGCSPLPTADLFAPEEG